MSYRETHKPIRIYLFDINQIKLSADEIEDVLNRILDKSIDINFLSKERLFNLAFNPIKSTQRDYIVVWLKKELIEKFKDFPSKTNPTNNISKLIYLLA